MLKERSFIFFFTDLLKVKFVANIARIYQVQFIRRTFK